MQKIINQLRAELDALHKRLDEAAAACAKDAATSTVYALPAAEIILRPGEHYAGLVLDATTGKPSHHLVLLAGEAGELTWAEATAWAEENGGNLPTSQEQALLFANLKREFEGARYWSGEKSSSGSAWSQSFDVGSQDFTTLSSRLHARAVRRTPVKPINPSA